MPIHWYPGHMHKANKEMVKVLPKVDIVIELLDARIPYSSQNPAIAKLRQHKPCIKILSKSDLADPATTAIWQTLFEQETSVKTLLTTLAQSDKAQRIIQLCHKLVPSKSRSNLDILAMITGIPNVGKSTLINAIAGRKVAKTGNEPAITKGQHKINTEDGVILLDTPGILWPKIHNENSGYRLAATGAIRDTAMDVEDVAIYLSEFLLRHYPGLLLKRYELDVIPETEIEFLELMGVRRGCIKSGGQMNFERVSSILVNEFRSGKLGPISLETPQMIVREEAIVKAKQIDKAERDAMRKQKYRRGRDKSG